MPHMSRFFKSVIIIAVLIGGYYLFTSIFGSTSVSIEFGRYTDDLTITGPMKSSIVINYDDIESLELVDGPSDPGEAKGGGKFLKSFYGLWNNSEWGDYNYYATGAIFSKSNTKKCILVTEKDGTLVLFNYNDDDGTTNMFRLFNDILDNR